MSVTDMIFGRWELAVAQNVNIRKNAEAILVCRLTIFNDISVFI